MLDKFFIMLIFLIKSTQVFMDTVTMLLLCLCDFMVLLNFKQASKEMMMGIIGKMQSFDCNQQHIADKCRFVEMDLVNFGCIPMIF